MHDLAAVTEQLLFTPETKTGAPPSAPPAQSPSPGEPRCKLLYDERPSQLPMFKVRCFEWIEHGGIELELSMLHDPNSSLVHLSGGMSVGKEQTCASRL